MGFDANNIKANFDIDIPGLPSINDILNGKPKVAYKFVFIFGALITGGFSKVKNIERKISRFYYNEGGLNSEPHILADQQKEPHQLVLEKGFVRPYAMKLAFDLEVLTDTHVWMPGFLYVAKNNFAPIRLFAFKKGRITEWSTSDLDAKDPNIMVDNITIIHDGLVEVPVTF